MDVLHLQEYSALLVIFLLFTLFTKWVWGRRRMYYLAAKVPGPFSLPLVGVFYLFLIKKDNIFLYAQNALKKYPKICKVWFGPKLYFTIHDPKYIDIILNHPSCMGKDTFYNIFRDILNEGLLISPVQKWRKNRKIINPTFNQKILDSFVEIFAKTSEAFAKKMENKCGTMLDVFPYAVDTSLNNICETAMGTTNIVEKTKGKFSYYANRSLELSFFRIFTPFYQFDSIFKYLPMKKEWDEVCDQLHHISGSICREKLREYENRTKDSYTENTVVGGDRAKKVFIDYLLEYSHQKDNGKFTELELRQEVDTFTLAGFHASAATVSFALICLALYPEIQKRAYDEVMEVLGPDRQCTSSDLPDLKYLECVIKETLRFFPSGPGIGRVADDDVDLGDYILPKGSSLLLTMALVQRNPLYWPDPLHFDPERFNSENAPKIVPGSYLPFSLGPRSCIGSKFGMMSVKTTLSTLLRQYSVTTDFKDIASMEPDVNVLLVPKNGHRVMFHKRVQ